MQKNPSTIRTPEEDKGRENYTMTGWVNLDRSSPISRHLSICSEAKDSTYVRDVDLKSWAELPGKEKNHNFPLVRFDVAIMACTDSFP